MKTLFISFICLLCAAPSVAENISQFELDNGLEVVVIEDHRAPVVVQTLWYKVGSADEAPGKSGIAHFLEHLLFKGTENLKSGEFSETVTRNGGSDNAFTSWDYTAYYQRIASDRLELIMRMEADRMRNVRMSEEEVATERQVILEERSLRVDSDPSALFREQLRASQFLNHHYGIPIIGWRHEMEELSREDALAFYDLYYAPNNAILVIAGDVDPDEVHKLAQKYYGPIAPSYDLPPRVRPQEPPQLAERRLSFSDPRISQAVVSRQYLAPERNSGDQKEAAALTLFAELLGGNMSTAYLAKKLAIDDPKAVFVGAFYNGTTIDYGSLDLVIVPLPNVGLQEAEDLLDMAVADFLEAGVDHDELARLKAQLRASEIYERDNVGSLSRRYGQELAIGLELKDIQSWNDELQAVTAEEIIAAAKKVLNRNNSVTGWQMPPAQRSTNEVK